MSKGNPFEEDRDDLVWLNNQVSESAAAAVSIHKFASIGKSKYNNLRKSVLNLNDSLLTVQIKRNNVQLFHENKTQRKIAMKQRMPRYKDQDDQYEHSASVVVLYSRGESFPHPPALLSACSLIYCTKYDLLYIMKTSMISTIFVD